MKTEKNVTVADIVAYGVLTFIANLAGTLVMLLIAIVLRKTIGLEAAQKAGLVFIIILVAASIAGTLFVTFLYLRYKLPDIVPKSENGISNTKTITSYFLTMILPAEVFRAILTSIPTRPGSIFGFGYRFFDGIFAFNSNFLFDQFYLTPQGRWDRVWDHGFSTQDNLVFFAVHIVCFVIHLFLLYLLYTKVWRNYEEARNSEVKMRMDPEQMK